MSRPSATAMMIANTAIISQLVRALQRKGLLSHKEIDDLLADAAKSIGTEGRSIAAAKESIDLIWNILQDDREDMPVG